ncbi:hypothetical protein EU99_1846 [Prochlorococcus marinus str. MIT 9321]|uniref:Glycosyl transferase family 25 domain-containing protein n=2 Tax=Prochlorococcaceae TaxID=2881426 RepID=A0A0A2B9N4_PROMR|nr:hypothetical protein EU99_1846 [Prochlorococcus marinus str. MIT 9321]KGG05507.1 hypothetical protein EV00_1141 [Prochlorococcus marinus str. MIT 9322]KGG10541.1 hypothetical protein EV01_0169 [Prochlorococcus marinus str. MIT 9401]
MISKQNKIIINSNNLTNRLKFFYYLFKRFEFDLKHKNEKRIYKRLFCSFLYLSKLTFNFVFFSNNKVSNSLKRIMIENEVTKKHIKAWRNFNISSAEYIMVFEDDVVCKKYSNKKLKELIKSLKTANFKYQYIDLAGGYSLEKVIPKNKIIQKNDDFIITNGIFTNTACGYLINKSLVRNWLNHLDKEKFDKKFPIDFLMNYLGDNIKSKTISKHFIDPIFLHGSFNGKVNSWQAAFKSQKTI